MAADVYALPPMDALALPRQAELTQATLHASLPDILDPRTGANNPVRHVCCIGAGYVGKSL